MPILAFTGSLTRPAPNYGEANGRGITSFALEPATDQIRPEAEYRGIDDTSDPGVRALLARCRAGLGEEAFAAAWARGRALAEPETFAGQTSARR